MAKLRELMTENPIALPLTATVAEAARAMRDHDIGDVLVMDRGVLYGILTDRDIVLRAIAEGLPMTTQLERICTRSPFHLGPADADEAALRAMRDHAVRRLPVVEGGRPVGIVSLGDLVAKRDPQSVLADISGARPNH